jgi:hypothetical protein
MGNSSGEDRTIEGGVRRTALQKNTRAEEQETGDRRQETGDRRQETGDRRQRVGVGVGELKSYIFVEVLECGTARRGAR